MSSARDAQRFGTVVVIGGGCYGSYYLRQLERAHRAGAVAIARLLVVDRDAQCQVARGAAGSSPVPVQLITAGWSEFLAEFLARAAEDPSSATRDAIVPSPLMPHLLYEWLHARVAAAVPDAVVEQRPLDTALDVPWQRAGDDGTHYASYATWMCPINCIEPARCPHTKGPRDWTMPVALQRHRMARPAADDGTADGRRAGDAIAGDRFAGVAGPYVFHCTHRVYGVGMIDVAPVLAADADLRRRAMAGPVDALVGTVSHCHGAVSRLVVARAASPH